MEKGRRIRVLIVDDSAFIRDILLYQLSISEQIEVVGVAADPYEARAQIKALNPDVITLDVEMPHMNGIAFLDRLMRLHPLPVVMVSSLTRKGEDVTLLALEKGAIDFVAKPLDGSQSAWDAMGQALRHKIIAASKARISTRAMRSVQGNAASERSFAKASSAIKLIAIGASTGGVEALRDILLGCSPCLPPIVVVQHMPAGFTQRFAQRLNELTPFHVFEASHGAVLKSGDVAIAAGHAHLRVERQGQTYVCAVQEGAPVHGHQPSVDVLFESVARMGGAETLGVILTGMGRDGAVGLLAMRQVGAQTLGQSESSCLVYGMPRAAKELGAVQQELSLRVMPVHLMSLC